MNINDYEAEVIASAVNYFIKQNITGVSAQQKSKLNNEALEAVSLIRSKDREIDITHIQALYAALNLYLEYLRKSLLTNPKILNTAEKLLSEFYNYLEPLLDNY